MNRETRRAALIATLVAVPVAVLAGVLAFWLLGGQVPEGTSDADESPRPVVSSSVSMPAPSLSERAAVVCRGLIARLPDELGGLPRRPVTDGSEQNAAYGEPPRQVACGAQPVVLPSDSTATVYLLQDVCWYAEQTADGTRWTTVDREVPVAVTIPASVSEPGQWVAALSKYVAATPSGGQPPSGCRR